MEMCQIEGCKAPATRMFQWHHAFWETISAKVCEAHSGLLSLSRLGTVKLKSGVMLESNDHIRENMEYGEHMKRWKDGRFYPRGQIRRFPLP
jgi:hypothetical protein